MLLSTFELLLKPITPNPGTVSGSDRSLLQGYFLNIANPTNSTLNLRLRFNARTPNLDRSKLLVIRDTTGGNAFGNLTPQNTFDFQLASRDTGLIILQPDITQLDPANPADRVEVRGYVEIFVVVRFPFPGFASNFQLLVTPEHRGTFLPSPNGSREFDQLISAIPTMTGGSLQNVDTILDPIIINPPGRPIIPNPTLPVSNPVLTNGNNGVGNGEAAPQLQDIQQILTFMAQQIDSLNQRLPQEDAMTRPMPQSNSTVN